MVTGNHNRESGISYKKNIYLKSLLLIKGRKPQEPLSLSSAASSAHTDYDKGNIILCIRINCQEEHFAIGYMLLVPVVGVLPIHSLGFRSFHSSRQFTVITKERHSVSPHFLVYPVTWDNILLPQTPTPTRPQLPTPLFSHWVSHCAHFLCMNYRHQWGTR